MSRPLPTDSLSLTAGGAGLVTDARGAIAADSVTGLVVDDVRILSRWQLDIVGPPAQVVAHQRTGPSSDCMLATIGSADSIDPVATFERRRTLVSRGLREELRITAFAGPVTCTLRIDARRDDQPITVLGDPGFPDRGLAPGASPDTFELASPSDGQAVEVRAPGWELRDEQLQISVAIDRGGEWTSEIAVTATDRSDGRSDGTSPTSSAFSIRTSPDVLGSMVTIAGDDLRALTIPLHGRWVLGAGSPYFLALFGRDSLIAGMQALVGGAQRLTDILDVLARYQATAADPVTRAQPGRILHELRLGDVGLFGVPPRSPYYGAVDTAALFVVAIGEAMRWGAPPEAVANLVPAARAALEWCARDGDVDGDGFVESVPDPGGLTNLGWKDSGDAIVRADGSTLVASVALPEVQAYWYRAERDLAEVESRLGVADGADHLAIAERLAKQFAEAFVYEGTGGPFVGLALDERKRLVDVRASNAGHVLWSGVLPPRVAEQVAEQLVADDLFSGWGVRTLSRDAAGYNPFGYHRGTVWPHDTGFALHGAARYGAAEVVRALAGGLVALGSALGGQLPELVGGIGRDELPLPVPYAAACRPQAWAAGAILSVLRAVLGLEPDVPAGVVRLHPALPAGWRVELRGLRLGDHELSIVADSDTVVDVDAGTLDVITGDAAVLAATGWCPHG